MHKLFSLPRTYLFTALIGFALLVLMAFFYTHNRLILLAPIAIIGLGALIIDIRYAYILMVISLPFSLNPVEQGGPSIDVPTEPLMIILTAIFPFLVLLNKSFFNKQFLKNPLIGILLVWLFWILVCSITSTHPMLSFKFFAAKLWYIIPFVGVTALVVYNDPKVLKTILALFLFVSFVIISIVIVKHKSFNFSFEDVSNACVPFFRNHVTYGSFASLIFPVIIVAWGAQKKYSLHWITLSITTLLFLSAIYLSFSRGAWAAIFISLLCYIAVRLKIMQYAIIAAYSFIIIGAIYMQHQNKYLNFSPKYETGIMHQTIADHLLATIKGKDISSNERFYRWIAAARMWRAKPITGYGPNTFYHNYKPHTVSSFRTYVSRNDERSTTHNYFLFTLVEQGLPGVIIYASFVFILFIYGQNLYFKLRNNKKLQRMVMAVLCMQASFLLSNFLSELIEVDKLGGIFFMGIGILVGIGLLHKKQNEMQQNLVANSIN